MSLDTALRKVSQTVLGTFGTAITIRRVTVGAYSPATGTQQPVKTDQQVKARLDGYLDRELSDTVHVGDRKCSVAAADLTWVPVVHDVVLIAGKTWEIKNVESAIAKDLAALYVFQVRG